MEMAICTLASLVLPAFINDDDTFDFATLHKVAKVVVRNTDRIIDLNRYPTADTRTFTQKTCALEIGVQGLANIFMMLHLPFDSLGTGLLNVAIFETIYHAAVKASCELARDEGLYTKWNGSPASSGLLQFDLWG